MGLCASSSGEDDAVLKARAKHIAQYQKSKAKQDVNEITLILLGAVPFARALQLPSSRAASGPGTGESGKSTVFKNMEVRHAAARTSPPFFSRPRCAASLRGRPAGGPAQHLHPPHPRQRD